jgi:outer membrane immunogenic protein
LTGWTIGAGVEHAFTDNLSAKAEFLYVDLGNLEIPTSCGGGCFTDVKFSVARVGLNYNF